MVGLNGPWNCPGGGGGRRPDDEAGLPPAGEGRRRDEGAMAVGVGKRVWKRGQVLGVKARVAVENHERLRGRGLEDGVGTHLPSPLSPSLSCLAHCRVGSSGPRSIRGSCPVLPCFAMRS